MDGVQQDNRIQMLRLKDGRGWVPNIKQLLGSFDRQREMKGGSGVPWLFTAQLIGEWFGTPLPDVCGCGNIYVFRVHPRARFGSTCYRKPASSDLRPKSTDLTSTWSLQATHKDHSHTAAWSKEPNAAQTYLRAAQHLESLQTTPPSPTPTANPQAQNRAD